MKWAKLRYRHSFPGVAWHRGGHYTEASARDSARVGLVVRQNRSAAVEEYGPGVILVANQRANPPGGAWLSEMFPIRSGSRSRVRSRRVLPFPGRTLAAGERAAFQRSHVWF